MLRADFPVLYRPAVFPPMDKYFQDVTQANVAPGFGMLTPPSGLNGNAQEVSVGSTFSVGIDRDGNVYEWGTFPNEETQKIFLPPARWER